MKVWNRGKLIEMEIGQNVFVGRCGSMHTVFGEYAKLERTTKQHLVFKTESGGIIKTAIDNLYKVAGKAGQQDWWVSPYTEREFIPQVFYVY